MKGYGLRRRLALVMLLSFLLGLGGASFFFWAEVGELQEDLLRHALQKQATVTGSSVQGDAVALEGLPVAWRTAYERPDSLVYYALYAADGRKVDQSPNFPTALPSPFGLPFGAVGRVESRTEDVGFTVVPAEGGRLLQVARADLSSPGLVEALTEEAIEFLFYTLLPFAVIAMVAIWLVVGWSLRPVLQASRAAAGVGPDAPDARIPINGLPMEVLPLVDAANGALQRLTSAYASVRRLTADAAHELRTPLAALTLRLQRAQLGGELDWAAIERELGHMRRLVQQMLTLARRESQATDTEACSKPVNLVRLAREVAASLLPLVEAAGRSLEVDAPEPVVVTGQADELHDMLRNLIENALGHGAGKITVRVGVDSAGSPEVVVADEGRGIPPEFSEAVFERFRKIDPASPGAGLGLAIVRRVVERHDGRIDLLPGSGCQVRVTLRPAMA
jgi:signal transduction histidine kinase